MALVDKRQVLTTDPRDALVTLKQVTITFPANVDKETAQPKLTAFSQDLKTL